MTEDRHNGGCGRKELGPKSLLGKALRGQPGGKQRHRRGGRAGQDPGARPTGIGSRAGPAREGAPPSGGNRGGRAGKQNDHSGRAAEHGSPVRWGCPAADTEGALGGRNDPRLSNPFPNWRPRNRREKRIPVRERDTQPRASFRPTSRHSRSTGTFTPFPALVELAPTVGSFPISRPLFIHRKTVPAMLTRTPPGPKTLTNTPQVIGSVPVVGGIS